MQKNNHEKIQKALNALGIKKMNGGTSLGADFYGEGKTFITSISPVDNTPIASVKITQKSEYNEALKTAQKAFEVWRLVPAPKRGEIVRQIGEELRKQKENLALLVSYEMGKSYQEGLGEVQEMIDIADFAVGLSRQLYGLTMHSERANHRMYEQYHPLGVVGIISAFNFPVAVWSWNSFLAWICGDVCVWKASEKTPLCAIACQEITSKVFKNNNLPLGISIVVTGGKKIGEWMSEDTRIPLVSATGSTKMGRELGQKVAARFGKSLLELGGNNAIVVTPSADIALTIRAAVFGAVGTCGQRCTTTRRLIVHDTIYNEIKSKLVKAYEQLNIGNPLNTKNHIGPLIDEQAVQAYLKSLKDAEQQGGKIITKQGIVEGKKSKNYVYPAIVEVSGNLPVVLHETFAPILYLMKYSDLSEAIALQNAVPQGLSSSILTNNLRDMELFLSCKGSDCGIANVNIGTSGAEIGGAFGGEKETGGGRESGSDAWKIYMRRQTNTINYGTDLPLAQGIQFDF